MPIMKTIAAIWNSLTDNLIYILLFSFISFALINSFHIDKHLSADGVHYFRTILDNGDFTYIAWSRQFANYLTQWPLVIAVRLGVINIPILSKFFAFGIYFPYILAFALCIYAMRRNKSPLILFSILSIVGINLSSDYILAGEHHVMVLLSWPIILLSLRREAWTWIDGFILWILLALFSRTYETAIIPAIIFSAIFVVKIYYNRQSKKQVFISAVSLFLSILVFIISLYFIFNPRDTSNKASFLSAIKLVFSNQEALVATSFAFLFTVGLISRKISYMLLSAFPIAIYTFIVLFASHGITAHNSFANRTLSMTLLPFLLIFTIVSQYYNIQLNKISTKIFVAFVLVMVIGNLRFSNDWNSFRQQVVETVITGKEYIPIEETAVKDSPYRWSWNNPELGLVWSYPCVRAILLNSPKTTWEPFNPRDKIVLKSYLSYTDFFKSVDQNIKVCK